MDSVAVDFEYRREDEVYRARRVMRRAGNPSSYLKSRYGIINLCLALPVALLLISGVMSWTMIIVCLVLVTLALRNVWSHKSVYDDLTSPIYGRKHCTADANGFAIESNLLKHWISWQGVHDVEDSPRHILVFYDRIRSLAIPKSSFATKEEIANFLGFLRSHLSPSATIQTTAANDVAAVRGIGTILLLLLAVLMIYISQPVLTSEAPPVTFTTERTKVMGNNVVVMGKVTNNSSSDWSLGMLELYYFDKNGTFIDKCDAYSSIYLKAGHEDYFKATCGVPQAGQAGQEYGFILPETLKNFVSVEIKARNGYKGGLLSVLR